MIRTALALTLGLGAAAQGQSTSVLAPANGVANDQFGVDVAVDGDVAVVGAHQSDYNGLDNPGGAYVYVRDATSGVWEERAFLRPSVVFDSNAAGTAVAISGDTIVITAIRDDGAGNNVGGAFVFVEPPGGWLAGTTLTETRRLLPSDGLSNDQFGNSVAMEGDTVVIGSNFHTANSTGAVYVYVEPPSGWAGAGDLEEDAKLELLNSVAAGWLGQSVDIDGTTVIAGAAGENAAYIFERPGPSWIGTVTESARLVPLVADLGSFGRSVVIDGDVAAVGAYQSSRMVRQTAALSTSLRKAVVGQELFISRRS